MRRWWWVALFVVLVSACGGNDSDGVIESENGLATLALQPGSLPEGVSAEDLSLEVIVDENAEPGMPTMGVQLLPDGLVLAEPATLTVVLPKALDGGFMAILQSGDSIEFLEGGIERDDSGFLFQTSVRHFSVVWVYPTKFIETTITLEPGQVSVGQTQRAAATITADAGPVVLWFTFNSDPVGTWRQYTFSGPQPPFGFKNSVFEWSYFEGDIWDPESPQPVEITRTPTGWETSSASSKCVAANFDDVDLRAPASFNLTLLEKGEPATSAIRWFSRTLSELEQSSSQATSIGSVALLDVSRGDSIKVSSWARAIVSTACTEAAAAGSPTTSTTQPPTGSDPKGDGKNGDSQPVTPEEDVPGADIKSVRFERGPSGELCFIIDVYGDGETAAAEAGNYIVDVEIPGESGWGLRVEFSQGQAVPGKAWLGELASGRDRAEGAEVSVKWMDSDTMKVTVVGMGPEFGADTFDVSILVFSPGGEYFDSAEGVAGS